MATITFEVNDQELWEATWGSSALAWGSWWIDCEFLDEADWDKIGQVKLTIEDVNEKHVTKVLGLEDIAKALPIANQQVYMDLFNFGNYDAICADAILQVAMLGEVIYG